ncbi:hypothetical protein B0H17DRAFT_1145276 [Mycena rosella]|uniref:Uncharacterized protein n=1 Tax=Mycena rosella TaxID=1033263 RepID=A0AAD7CRM0_MYCRO|nr:hypothetical protein B0H17DRAFT_1145276 [Mycena rosella]
MERGGRTGGKRGWRKTSARFRSYIGSARRFVAQGEASGRNEEARPRRGRRAPLVDGRRRHGRVADRQRLDLEGVRDGVDLREGGGGREGKGNREKKSSARTPKAKAGEKQKGREGNTTGREPHSADTPPAQAYGALTRRATAPHSLGVGQHNDGRGAGGHAPCVAPGTPRRAAMRVADATPAKFSRGRQRSPTGTPPVRRSRLREGCRWGTYVRRKRPARLHLPTYPTPEGSRAGVVDTYAARISPPSAAAEPLRRTHAGLHKNERTPVSRAPAPRRRRHRTPHAPRTPIENARLFPPRERPPILCTDARTQNLSIALYLSAHTTPPLSASQAGEACARHSQKTAPQRAKTEDHGGPRQRTMEDQDRHGHTPPRTVHRGSTGSEDGASGDEAGVRGHGGMQPHADGQQGMKGGRRKDARQNQKWHRPSVHPTAAPTQGMKGTAKVARAATVHPVRVPPRPTSTGAKSAFVDVGRDDGVPRAEGHVEQLRVDALVAVEILLYRDAGDVFELIELKFDSEGRDVHGGDGGVSALEARQDLRRCGVGRGGRGKERDAPDGKLRERALPARLYDVVRLLEDWAGRQQMSQKIAENHRKLEIIRATSWVALQQWRSSAEPSTQERKIPNDSAEESQARGTQILTPPETVPAGREDGEAAGGGRGGGDAGEGEGREGEGAREHGEKFSEGGGLRRGGRDAGDRRGACAGAREIPTTSQFQLSSSALKFL